LAKKDLKQNFILYKYEIFLNFKIKILGTIEIGPFVSKNLVYTIEIKVNNRQTFESRRNTLKKILYLNKLY
jgi:hypothetical protein